jgi:hypothetical protein
VTGYRPITLAGIADRLTWTSGTNKITVLQVATVRAGEHPPARLEPASSVNNEPLEAMLIAAPALNPGWYINRFISGCD